MPPVVVWHLASPPTSIPPNQFPGLALRFKEGQQVTVDVYNDTDTPEQLHWHGQKLSTEVDGAAEEGTPFIPAHGQRRLVYAQSRGLSFL